MKKLFAIAAAVVAVSSLAFVAPVFADSPGSLATGPDLYQVRNVTKNSGYASSATATCDETVKFSIKLANSEFGLLTNVTVKAPLGGTMTASATNAANQPTSVSASVSVNTGQGTLVYVPGSTVNLNVDGGHIKNLPDGITTTGVNKGNLNGSTREFVQFQAKVKCDTPEVPKDIQVCELSTKKIITIKENQFENSKHSRNFADCATPGNIVVCEIATKRVITIKENEFDAAKHTRDMSSCNVTPVTPTTPTAPTPAVLPNTGVSEIIGMFAAVAVAGAIAHRFILARR